MNALITDKIIVVTGASSGAGRAIVQELAKTGAMLVIASRNGAVLETLAEDCREKGAEVLVVPTDMSRQEDVQQLAKTAHAWKGRVDVWVNNAGVLAAGAFDQTPWEVHEQVISTNLLGYLRGAYAILPYFKSQRQGILINNISIGGFLPVPFGGAYTASKFGLRGFFEALRGELVDWPDIHVVDLFPAFLNTPGIQHAANYTGRVLKPAPPISDPAVVARAVRRSIRYPRATRYPSAISLVLKAAHAAAPGVMVNATARVMQTYFHSAEPMEKTAGNVLQTVDYGMATHGNALPRLTPSTARTLGALGILLAGVGLAACGLARKMSRS